MEPQDNKLSEAKIEIEKILHKKLPNFKIEVIQAISFSTEPYLQIHIHSSDNLINKVRDQYPDYISLRLSHDLELKFQSYGGMGGQVVYRKVDPNIAKERYNALGGDKVPFRTPRPELPKVLKAIEKVAEDYKAIMLDIQKRGLLAYDKYVDYASVLKF